MLDYSEPALRNDQDVPGLHFDVRRNIATPDQVLQAHAVLVAAVRGSQYRSAVAVGEVGEAADRDHDIEQGHFLAVRQSLGSRSLAYDANLLAILSFEGCHDHRDDRIPNEPRQR